MADSAVEEIVVTAKRRASGAQTVARSLSVLGSDSVGLAVGNTHIQEALARVPV